MTFLPPKLNRELMKTSYAEVTRQRTSYWRPENGPNKLRILPGWPTESAILPFVALSQHFLGGEEKKSYICPATPGINRDCPICKVARLMRKPTMSEVEQELGKAISVRHTYLWNILVRGKESEGVKVFSAPGSAHSQILAYASDDENWPLFLDFERGADIILEKTGSGLQTRYAVRVQNASCVMHKSLAESQKLFETAPDLTQFLKAEPDEVLITALRKAQDIEDDDPVDDGSAVAAAVARVAKARPATVIPSSPAGPIGMGLAPAEDGGYDVSVEAEVDTPETVEMTGAGSIPKTVETTAGAAVRVKTSTADDAPVAVPSTGAARADLATLKARLKSRLNTGS